MYGVRSEQEIADLENTIVDQLNNGSKYPGMSYEEGIQATLAWLQNKDSAHPMEE
jgi:hypothetical protein